MAHTAPEVLQGEAYTQKSDIFSFGVLLWELVARSPSTFSGLNASQVQQLLIQGRRETIPPSCPIPYAQLIQHCWAQDPILRPDSWETIKFILSNIIDGTVAIAKQQAHVVLRSFDGYEFVIARELLRKARRVRVLFLIGNSFIFALI